MIHTKLGWVEYSLSGEGIPVLFVHGGHSNSRDTLFQKGWDKKKYQMITPSRPGYGRTPLENHQTPKSAADLFIALLDTLKINQVIVYGISAGGWTALQLAANHPDRVKKLILVSAVTTNWLDKKEKIYKIAKRIFHPKVEWLSWGLVHFIASATPGLMAKNFHTEFSSYKDAKITQEEVGELGNALKKYRSKTGFVNDIDQGIDPAILKQIRCPTLILHSRYDASVSPTHAEHAHKEIQHSQLHMLENKWGHMLCLGNDYQEVLGIINGFLDDHVDRPT
ncbi:alpha/beta fold hydrolase [Catalinimonas niigatensis]|uniref:alpha/beta fold hydrolase n=1 Tax=Catalinimonas niigatensis TaxID=1397264 RepID=UPI00266712FD|nr:alpha/beta hydrolase [Catalinimonas niigatensis]WPP52113.1 alpha/beta hydrolase [Catalinimonas niigatensis]